MIVERLQKELNMLPMFDDTADWPYVTSLKRRQLAKPIDIVQEDISMDEEYLEEPSLESFVDEVSRSAVNNVCCYNDDQLLSEQSQDYEDIEYEVCCVLPDIGTSQDTSQDIIQHSSQNIYINRDNSSQDIIQDTSQDIMQEDDTLEEVIQPEISEQEREDAIKELLVRGISIVS